jgi:hypothetical protein
VDVIRTLSTANQSSDVSIAQPTHRVSFEVERHICDVVDLDDRVLCSVDKDEIFSISCGLVDPVHVA